MSRIAWSVVVIAAALAACSGKSDHAASTASSVGNGSGTNTTGTATASANTADTSASPAAAVGGPTSTPAAATNSSAGTTTADAGTASSTGVMGASPAASGGKGQQVFSQTCVACHGAGVAGAPKVGDKADWGPRIAQGQPTLYQHALNGYQGKKGVMPPKGGNTALADADVKAAVDYMVAQAK